MNIFDNKDFAVGNRVLVNLSIITANPKDMIFGTVIEKIGNHALKVTLDKDFQNKKEHVFQTPYIKRI